MTVNPVAPPPLASQLVAEPVTLDLIPGLIAASTGLRLATAERKTVLRLQ